MNAIPFSFDNQSYRCADPMPEPQKISKDNPKSADVKVQICFELMVKNSNDFASKHPFPTQKNLIKALVINETDKQDIEARALNTHPIVHQRVLSLIQDFLKIKLELGTSKEKQLYKDMTPTQFIDRLIHKRPLAFLTADDYYLLRNGRRGEGGFELIGTENEIAPLCLNDYLSYDEMQISALIGLTVPTRFINNGWRNNRGEPGKKGEYIESGIYYGLVGARLEKPGVMEWQHVVITPDQNKRENGYGVDPQPDNLKRRLLTCWAKFYQLAPFPTFEEAKSDTSGKYLKISEDIYFNKQAYKERLRMTVEPFLVDANEQARKAGKKGYIQAVGIGLGNWCLAPEQGKLMLDVYAEVIAKNSLQYVSDIDFSWISAVPQICGTAQDGQFLNNIRIHFSKRNPAMPLPPRDKDKLLICSYAWDGNSYPGNEYWLGPEYLAASGDPAAACCSNIVRTSEPRNQSDGFRRKCRYFTAKERAR